MGTNFIRIFGVFMLAALLLGAGCTQTVQTRNTTTVTVQGNSTTITASTDNSTDNGTANGTVGQDYSSQGRSGTPSADFAAWTPRTFKVAITEAGFEPSEINIWPGDSIIFINQDKNPHWPASNPHPIHTDYPVAGGCIGSTFDSCKGLNYGESFTFKFDKIGIWGYHDHLHPGMTGTVTVVDVRT